MQIMLFFIIRMNFDNRRKLQLTASSKVAYKIILSWCNGSKNSLIVITVHNGHLPFAKHRCVSHQVGETQQRKRVVRDQSSILQIDPPFIHHRPRPCDQRLHQTSSELPARLCEVEIERNITNDTVCGLPSCY